MGAGSWGRVGGTEYVAAWGKGLQRRQEGGQCWGRSPPRQAWFLTSSCHSPLPGSPRQLPSPLRCRSEHPAHGSPGRSSEAKQRSTTDPKDLGSHSLTLGPLHASPAAHTRSWPRKERESGRQDAHAKPSLLPAQS